MDVRSNHSSSSPRQATGAGSVSVSGSDHYARSGTGSLVEGGAATDVLGVAAAAGPEPVTHFNLDQLLEIVQSFQLDTTMAGHDEATGHRRPPIDLTVARNVDMVSHYF